MAALITLAELKAYMPIRAGDTSYDEQLGSLIRAVSARVEKACRQTFGRMVREEVLDVQVGSSIIYDITGFSLDGLIETLPGMLRLSHGPVDDTAPFEVYYDRSRRFGPETILQPELITLFADRSLLYIRTPLTKGTDILKVIYTAGADIPDDIKLAVVEQCLFEFKRLQYANAGAAEQNNDDQASKPWATKGGLLPSVVAALGPHRRLLRGRG